MRELEKWINHFQEKIPEHIEDIQFEQKTGHTIRRTGEVSKEQLQSIIDWKFSEQKHYHAKVTSEIGKLSDEEIKEVTKTAFQMKHDFYKIKLICAIQGVGPVLASIILAFYDPHDFGIFDHSTWDQLFPEQKRDISVKGYLKVLDKMREIASEYQVPVRVIDQALWIKNYEENR